MTRRAAASYNGVLVATPVRPDPFSPSRLQLDEHGRLRHFLCIAGLAREHLVEILDTAESFAGAGDRAAGKVPLLRGKTVVNLFFEASTRTRSTFELAAKRLSADVLNLDMDTAAVQKGESLIDTLRNMRAMDVDMFIVRHGDSGAAQFIARNVGEGVAVVNAGDGGHAHPTQAMLDMFTIRRCGKDFAALRVAIVGDIRHSRVARSQIAALNLLGARDIRLAGPQTLMPAGVEQLGARVFSRIEDALAGADVVIILRLQRERMRGGFLPSEGEYYRRYGLTSARLALADAGAIVMHPGPINRGVEISSLVADGARSVILRQVAYGIAVRMAVMSLTVSGQIGGRPR